MALVVLRPLLSVPELQKALGMSGYATPDSKAYGLSLKRKTSCRLRGDAPARRRNARARVSSRLTVAGIG